MNFSPVDKDPIIDPIAPKIKIIAMTEKSMFAITKPKAEASTIFRKSFIE
jgi:hypothetical protein